MAEETPTWAWYVGALGKIMWIKSKKDLPARLPSDPDWYSLSNSAALEPVEILLLQGSWDSLDQRLCANGTRLILRCVESRARGSKGAKRAKLNANAAHAYITDNLLADWEAGTFNLAHKIFRWCDQW